jgi:peptidoglycan hydrolase-like protein with peptidoglycan-binding domain
VIAVAGVVLVAGCGSSTSKKSAPASTGHQTTPPPTASSAKKKPKSPSPSKASTVTGKHQLALGWIRNLQRDLTTLHFYAGPITGVETAATKTAVIRFQRAAHLKPDGLWGARSQAALDKMLHRH